MCLGIPGQIVAISDTENELGIVDVSGVRREINLVCVIDENHPIESCVGDWVLVHVGFAMSRIDETEAAATLKILEATWRGRARTCGHARVWGGVTDFNWCQAARSDLRCQTIEASKSSTRSCMAGSRIRWR